MIEKLIVNINKKKAYASIFTAGNEKVLLELKKINKEIYIYEGNHLNSLKLSDWEDYLMHY